MAPMQARDQGGNAERTCSEVRSGATAGRGGRGVIVYAGGEGAARDGGGHESTRSALQCGESLPFSARSPSMWCRAAGRGEVRRVGATCLVVATVLGTSGGRKWEVGR
jgi:hypothetical protein